MRAHARLEVTVIAFPSLSMAKMLAPSCLEDSRGLLDVVGGGRLTCLGVVPNYNRHQLVYWLPLALRWFRMNRLRLTFLRTLLLSRHVITYTPSTYSWQLNAPPKRHV